jgi:hypothetical protein
MLPLRKGTGRRREWKSLLRAGRGTPGPRGPGEPSKHGKDRVNKNIVENVEKIK